MICCGVERDIVQRTRKNIFEERRISNSESFENIPVDNVFRIVTMRPGNKEICLNVLSLFDGLLKVNSASN